MVKHIKNSPQGVRKQDVQSLESVRILQSLWAELSKGAQLKQEQKLANRTYASIDDCLSRMDSLALREGLKMYYDEYPSKARDFLHTLTVTDKLSPSGIEFQNMLFEVQVESCDLHTVLYQHKKLWDSYLETVSQELEKALDNLYDSPYSPSELIEILDCLLNRAQEFVFFMDVARFDGYGIETDIYRYTTLVESYIRRFMDVSAGDRFWRERVDNRLLVVLLDHINCVSPLSRDIAAILGEADLSTQQGAWIETWAQAELQDNENRSSISVHHVAVELLYVVGTSYRLETFDELIAFAKPYLANRYVREFLGNKAKNRAQRLALIEACEPLLTHLEEEDLAWLYADLAFWNEMTNKKKKAAEDYYQAIVLGAGFIREYYVEWLELVSEKTFERQHPKLLKDLGYRTQKSYHRGPRQYYPAVLDIYAVEEDWDSIITVFKEYPLWSRDTSFDSLEHAMAILESYSSDLLQENPQDLLELYSSMFTSFIEGKKTSNDYLSVVGLLEKLSSLPGQYDLVVQVIEELRASFPTRRRFLEDLDELEERL